MDKNKKIMVIIAVIVVIVIVVILAVVFGGKGNAKPPKFDASNSIVKSLNAGSQSEIDNVMIEDLRTNKYTLDQAKIYMNPYGTSPLSAMLIFMSDSDTDVTVTIKGKHNDDISYTYEGGTEHYVPVYALYAAYDNTVEVKLATGQSKTFTITTESLGEVPTVSDINRDASYVDNGLYFITSPIYMHSFAVDSYGEIRWLTNSTNYHDFKWLGNGKYLIGEGLINDLEMGSNIIEVDLLGRLYGEYNIGDGYLNDIFIKEDGNLIVASRDPEKDFVSELIVEIDSNTGKIAKSWNLLKMFEQIDKDFTSKLPYDWFYNSGIEYYPESDSLLLTYWGGEFVINLSYTSGEIKWIFSNPSNFSSAFDKYLLKTTEGFIYPKAMHSGMLDGDTLRVFDNGYSTNARINNLNKLAGSYSSANTYTVSNGTITLVSSINNDKTLFSYALADYKHYSDNTDLVLFGRELYKVDYTSEYDINMYYNLFSHIIEQKDGKAVLEFNVSTAALTIERVSLAGTNKFEFSEPEAHTNLEPTPKEELTTEMVNLARNATETIPYTFGFSNSMIEHNVTLFEPESAKLILITESNTGAVYTLKVAGEATSRRIVLDLPVDKYYVYVLKDDVVYKTDSFIEIK